MDPTVSDDDAPRGHACGDSYDPVQNPLTLVMPIASPEDSRQLRALLHHIQSLPPDENPVWTALEKIGTVHFARFVFLDDDTKLAVITTFDNSFETYINDFVDEIGEVFDQLLSHMADAPPLPVATHREEFLKYVKEHDAEALQPFYSAYPNLTVLDIQALAAGR